MRSITNRRSARVAKASGALAISLLVIAPAIPAAAETAPSAPRSLSAVAGPGSEQVALAWGAPTSSSPILDYGFERSLDSGATWGSTTWLGETSLGATSTTVAALACPNSGSTGNGKGCRYRVRARNAIGISSPSATVSTWSSPSVPRNLVAVADAAIASVTVSWRIPSQTGSFPTLSYVLETSVDGGMFSMPLTTTATSVTVPCHGATSCRYQVFAVNGQGAGPSTLSTTFVTRPGRVQSLEIRTVATHLGSGVTDVAVSWHAPTTGLPATSYLYATCSVASGATTGCDDTSPAWTPPILLAASDGPTERSAICTDHDASCYFRVAAVNSRGGSGAWRTSDLRPWAPFNVAVTPGHEAGKATISFEGPSESGNAGSSKYYKAYICGNDCGNDTSWRDAGLAIPYPPSPPNPYIAGAVPCEQGTRCSVRMQFFDGQGRPGPVSPAASGPGLTLTVATPADGSTTNDRTPDVTGLCTVGLGTVTATVLPGLVTVTEPCSLEGIWTGTVAGNLADGTYSVSATQEGTAPGTVSNTNSFTIDTTPPVVTITSPVSGATFTSNAVIITGTCSELDRLVTVTITGSLATLTPTCSGGSWIAAVSLSTGSYSAVASQSNVLGTTGTSATVPFSVNATSPTVDIAKPTDGAVLATSQPAFTGTCTAAAGAVTVTITGLTSVSTPAACVAGAWSLSPAPTLADRGYSVVARQTVGGTTFTSTPHLFQIDTAPPTTTDTTSSIGSSWQTSVATVRLVVAGGELATTYYTLDGSMPSTASPSGTLIELTADGIFLIRYFSIDVAGNVEAVRTASVQVRIDRTAPTVAITYPVSGSVANTTRWNAGCSPVGICGSRSDALSGVSGVSVMVRRLSDSRYWNGSTWVTAATSLPATGTANWVLPIAAGQLTNGVSYAVTATATDLAGNTATANSTFTYDTSDPQVSSVTAANGNWSMQPSDKLTVTFNEAIDPMSLPSTATLTLRKSGGGCSQSSTTYQISGLTSGQVNTGSCGYLKGGPGTLSTVTWDGTISVTGNVVVFTVTTGCLEQSCGSSVTSSAPSWNKQFYLSYQPASTIRDMAGNGVKSSTVTYCRTGLNSVCGAPW